MLEVEPTNQRDRTLFGGSGCPIDMPHQADIGGVVSFCYAIIGLLRVVCL